MNRRAWLILLWLYAAGVAADVAIRLREDLHIGAGRIGYPEVAVAVAAGLFWPLDLIVRFLLKSSP